jgi:putative transposase
LGTYDRYGDAEPLRCLTVKDEATGYCLAIKTGRHLQHQHVKAALEEMATRFETPKAIRSDNGSELLSEALQEQMKNYGIKLAIIEPGKPWQNGSNENFNGTFQKECLNAEIFASLTEVQVIIEEWRRRYDERRPHSLRNYITPETAFFWNARKTENLTRQVAKKWGQFNAADLTLIAAKLIQKTGQQCMHI